MFNARDYRPICKIWIKIFRVLMSIYHNHRVYEDVRLNGKMVGTQMKNKQFRPISSKIQL